jgi:hypothetical protein
MTLVVPLSFDAIAAPQRLIEVLPNFLPLLEGYL